MSEESEAPARRNSLRRKSKGSIKQPPESNSGEENATEIAKTSPPEIIVQAVADFCEDTISTATERLSPRNVKTEPEIKLSEGDPDSATTVEASKSHEADSPNLGENFQPGVSEVGGISETEIPEHNIEGGATAELITDLPLSAEENTPVINPADPVDIPIEKSEVDPSVQKVDSAQSSPRQEAVLEIVADFISSATEEQLVASARAKSAEKKDKLAPLELAEMVSAEAKTVRSTHSTPREVMDLVASQAAEVVQGAVTSAEGALSPRAAVPSPASPPSQPTRKSEAAVASPRNKKQQHHQQKTPRKGDQDPEALAQAAAYLDQQGSKSNKSKKDKEESSRKTTAPDSSDRDDRAKKKSRIPHKASPSPESLPPVRRPSPPVSEKSNRQTDNPRNRKLRTDRSGPDREESHRLPPIDRPHPMQDKGRNAKKGVRSSENIGEKRAPPRRIGSQSAPIPGDVDSKLPPIKGPGKQRPEDGEGSVPVRRRKKPLFLRLEDRAKKIQNQIDKEKMEMYHKIRQKRFKAQPTKEEIEEHMHKYQAMKLAHMEQEKEFESARKKDWRRKGRQLKKMGAGAASPLKKKIDFVEEQKLREREEEEQRKLRIERGREYEAAVRSGAEVPASPRSPTKSHVQSIASRDSLPALHSPRHLHPPSASAHNSPSMDVKALVGHPSSPRSNQKDHRKDHHQDGNNVSFTPRSQKEHNSPLRSPLRHQHQHQDSSPSSKSMDGKDEGGGDGSVEKKPPKRQMLSQMQSSIAEGPLDSPYEGNMGSEWVAEVMGLDAEEDKLAVIYETGFQMLMAEKGIIKSSDIYDDLLAPGVVVATPPVKSKANRVDSFMEVNPPVD